MSKPLTRRQFLATVPAIPGILGMSLAGPKAKPATTATISQGDLKVIFRDNSQSPKVLSGLASLVNQRDAPSFDAFDPASPGASAGLNFEHIISGHKNSHNAFAPRHGKYTLQVPPDGKSAVLTRRQEDDPWAMPAR